MDLIRSFDSAVLIDGTYIPPTPLPPTTGAWVGPLRIELAQPDEDDFIAPRRGGAFVAGWFYLTTRYRGVRNHTGSSRFHVAPEGIFVELTSVNAARHWPMINQDAGAHGLPRFDVPDEFATPAECAYAQGRIQAGLPVDSYALWRHGLTVWEPGAMKADLRDLGGLTCIGWERELPPVRFERSQEHPELDAAEARIRDALAGMERGVYPGWVSVPELARRFDYTLAQADSRRRQCPGAVKAMGKRRSGRPALMWFVPDTLETMAIFGVVRPVGRPVGWRKKRE